MPWLANQVSGDTYLGMLDYSSYTCRNCDGDGRWTVGGPTVTQNSVGWKGRTMPSSSGDQKLIVTVMLSV